jgi:hypothetical protein
MGLLKRKCNSKGAGKGLFKILSGKGRVYFSAKKCCVTCVKKQCREQRQEEGYLCKLMPMIYIKGNCYETMYGNVRSNKQGGDKGQGMRSGRSRVGGGKGRGGEKG